MIIINSTGGGGSSFVADEFSKRGWKVCLRPDGGRQKATHTVEQVYLERTKPFFENNLELEGERQYSQKELFDNAYKNLRNISNSNLLLLCMSWGGMGYLNQLEEKTIFLVRDPVFAYNSYSGGGWRSAGGERRIKHVGATGPNDKKWIDLFLGDFSMWVSGVENALKAYHNESGYIVRYHKFAHDWKKIEGVPPIYRTHKAKDNEEKIAGFLTQETVEYIREKTNSVWEKVQKIE